jgi:hypothetical protein
MQLPSFLQKFGRDLIYLSVIGALAGWIWVEWKREDEWNQILYVSSEQSFEKITQNNNYLRRFIENLTYGYPSSHNHKFQARAVSGNRLIVDLTANIGKVQTELSDDKTKNAKIVEYLRFVTRQLCDSFSTFSDEDSIFKVKIEELFELRDSTRFWKLIKSFNNDKAKVALNTLKQKTALAHSELLNYLNASMDNPEWKFDSFEPISTAHNSAIFVDGTYQTKIFLSPYNSFNKNITVKVDGEILPTSLGLAHFSRQFTSPGKKKYVVEIDLKNPLTGSIQSFKKEFSLIVVDSCR